MENQTPREERRLKWSDLGAFDFGASYAGRMGRLRDRIGDQRHKDEVSGFYPKAAFVGVALYHTAIVMTPFIYDAIKSGIGSFVK